jgi:predicted RNase H-like HicB family nuclease
MHDTAIVTKEGRQTLAEFPGCPGCQTFADAGDDIGNCASEALLGWLEALGEGGPYLHLGKRPEKVAWKSTFGNQPWWGIGNPGRDLEHMAITGQLG